MVVAVVDDVGGVDGGCAGIVSSDVAALGGVLGCVSRVWVAVSMVLGVVWVLKSAVVEMVNVVWILTLVVVMLSVWVSASSIKMAPWNSALAWAAIERQSPAPCPSVSHFRRSSTVRGT